jgi:hypothetical protein
MRQHLRARLAGRDDVDGRESGAVTAELAVTLPAVILLLAFLLAAGAAGITQKPRGRCKGSSSASVERKQACTWEATETGFPLPPPPGQGERSAH